MLVKYFLGGLEHANRTRDLVPRVGDEIRFNGIVYEIEAVVWIEDETPERVHILLTEADLNAKSERDLPDNA